jgi:hypothetical protein
VGGTPGAAAGPAFTGAPAGDADRDGFSDFLEYALGSNQGDGMSVRRPAAAVQNFTVSGVPGNFLTFAYSRNNAADGVTYTVELGTNLSTWDSSSSAVTYVSTTSNGDGTSTVLYRATQPMTAQPKQYMRLRVAP